MERTIDPVGASRAETGPAPSATDEARTERTIALVRMAVIVVVGGVYLSSIGIRRDLGPLAVSILALSGVYALWTVLVRPYETGLGRRFRAASLLADVALISLWTQATGGPASEFWTLYLVAVIAVALRFDLLETLGAAMGIALVYVTTMSAVGRLPVSALLARPSLMLITGFAVGVLAEQRRDHDRERLALELVVAERSQALAEEQEVVARLQRLDVAKTEFVSVASHEFRTPLSAIIGVLSTLRTHGDAIEPEVRLELLTGAERQAKRLARLVEDLLTISRIESGTVPLDIQPVHPERLAFEAEQASGTSAVLRTELNGVERVWCDADRIVRVLTNLLDNARKYSPQGAPILLEVRHDDRAVVFSVRDRGPGIPHAEREQVFDRFRRLVEGEGQPGAGLGLYITKALVEAHGGRIRVAEAPGGGAEFLFDIPQRSGRAPGEHERRRSPVPVT